MHFVHSKRVQNTKETLMLDYELYRVSKYKQAGLLAVLHAFSLINP